MAKKTFLHAEIPPELSTRLKATIPQGMLSSIVRLLMEALVTEVETNGHGVLGLILSKEFSVKSIVQILNTQEDQKNGSHPYKQQIPSSAGSSSNNDGGSTPRGNSRRGSHEESQGPDRERETPTILPDVPKGEGK